MLCNFHPPSLAKKTRAVGLLGLTMAPSSLVGGTWAGWSCAYSVSGVPLQVPADLCTPRTSAAGFRELTTEMYLQLQAPATGAFVERRVTKLMPNDVLPVQTKAGRLAQLHVHAVRQLQGDVFVQDSHYEGDVFVLQTVLPGPTALERRRLALLFDSASGELVRGMRAWREVRCAGSRFAEHAELDSSTLSGALAATWAAAELPVSIGCQGWAAAALSRPQPPSAALSCPPPPPAAPSRSIARAEPHVVAPSPAASCVELRDLGLTIHAAAGSLAVEAEALVNGQRQRLVVRRSFGDGACASTLKVF